MMDEEAIVMSILPNGFSVMLPKYGLEGFINLDAEDERKHQAKIKALLEKDSEQIINVRILVEAV